MKHILLFLLFSISLAAQTKGVVKDSISGKPIPFVSVWSENQNIGTTSEENGEFIINTNEKSKKLVFSALGFEKKTIKITDAKNVKLIAVDYQLDEVVISKPKRIKEIKIGNSKNRFYLPEPQVVPWIFAKTFYLDDKNADAKYIKTISFFTKSEVDGAIFRVRVFSIKNDMPNEDIVTDEIIVATKKGKHENIIDMSFYKLEIPKDGIVIGFESLFVSKNEYKQDTRIIGQKEDTYFTNYAPHILYHYIDSETSYAGRTGKWTKQLFRMFNKNVKDENRVIAPAITIKLTN